MSLAWSVHHDIINAGDSVGLKEKSVAVVGAGLAGLTCAVGMSLFGAFVTIYEKQTDLLGEMLVASHRDIHPTINFWPHEPITVSTNFPFFNWYQDSCDKVLQRIISEWEVHQFEKSIMGPMLTHELVGLKSCPAGWRLEIKLPGDKRSFPEVQIAVLATGFGKERDIGPDVAGYWELSKDYIGLIQTEQVSPFKNYVVSGTGDGGLIEVFRLLFSTFRAGKIQSSTAPLLNNEGIQNAIKKVESRIKEKVNDKILHEGAHLSDDFKDEISDEIWPEYVKLASTRINSAALRDLESRRSAIGHVTLLGRRRTPMEYGAAPYHRLLAACCIQQGWLSYNQVDDADVSDTGNKVVLGSGAEIPQKAVSFRARRIITQTGTEDPRTPRKISLKEVLYTCRHGALTPLKSLFSDPGDLEKIRRVQSLYADQDWISMNQANEYAELLDLAPPSDRVAWANGLAQLSADYFVNRHGLDSSLECKDDEAEYILYHDGPKFDVRVYEENKALIPSSFLGIKVRKKPAPYPLPRPLGGFEDGA